MRLPTQFRPIQIQRLTLLFSLLCGLAAGPFAVLYVRVVRWAERNKPSGWQRIVRPIAGLALLGLAASRFPQLLGNGRDVSQLLFAGAIPFSLAAFLLVLKPGAILLCVGSGVPGGLFTPSLTSGALLGAVLGYLWSLALPHVPVGLCAFLGAGAVSVGYHARPAFDNRSDDGTDRERSLVHLAASARGLRAPPSSPVRSNHAPFMTRD